jgi:glycosyltransferase involved in cell wall biosynthesis
MSAAIRPVHVVTLIDLVAEAGGAETLAAELVQRLDPERFRRTLVLYRQVPESSPLHGGQSRIIARLEAAGVRVIMLEGRDRRDLASWGPFLKLLRSGDVDVLHTHKYGPNLWGSLLSRLAPGLVFVAHEHTWSFEGRPLRKLADRWLIATRAAAFLAVSERDRRRMMEIEGVPADRIRLLPNGIPAVTRRPAVDIRGELGIPAGAPLVGSVGVFRAQKDFATLLRAHALLRERVPDAHLVIVGDGPERDALEALRAELGLDGSVTFTGFRADAVGIAAGFDVAVNSSRFEGASLAILEWMALGLPMVATAVGGTPELLAGGEAGVLVEPGEPRALAAAVAGLLEDPARGSELAQRARERQNGIYNIDVQVRRLEELYVGLVAAARRPGRGRSQAPATPAS